MTLQKTCAAFAAIGALSGCMSTGGARGDADYVELLDLEARALTATAVDPEDLPASATMTGVMAARISGEDETMVGNMTVEADFENSTLAGGVDDLGLYEVYGDYGVNNVCLSDCGADLVGELDGTLALSGTISGTSLDGTLTGDLTGSNDEGDLAATVALDLDGTVSQVDDGLIAAGGVTGTSVNTYTTADGELTEETNLFGDYVVSE